MPSAAIQAYVNELPKHKAEYQLMLITAASAPYMKEDARQALMENLNATIRGEEKRTPAHTPLAELARRAGKLELLEGAPK